MLQLNSQRVVALRAWWNALCPEREIFLRSGGHVKFLRISRRAQLWTLGGTAALLLGWGGVTAAMAIDGMALKQERAALAALQDRLGL